jgi:RNA polymerase-binding transcription factor DksA
MAKKKTAKKAPAKAVKKTVKKASAPAKAKKPAAPAKKVKIVAKPVKAAKEIKAKVVAKPVKAPVSKQPAAKALPTPVAPKKKATVITVVKKKEAVDVKKEKPAKLSKSFLDSQRQKLLDLREHLVAQMSGVAKENLRVAAEGSEASAFGMHQADAGSTAYERDFALSILSQEQDALYEIEEAIKRIEQGTYGVCEMSGEGIPMARLDALPFARLTVACQAQMERENSNRNRWNTTPQFMDTAENFNDEGEESSDEE